MTGDWIFDWGLKILVGVVLVGIVVFALGTFGSVARVVNVGSDIYQRTIADLELPWMSPPQLMAEVCSVGYPDQSAYNFRGMVGGVALAIPRMFIAFMVGWLVLKVWKAIP